MEVRNEVLSSVGAQDMDTSGYQVSDPDNVDFYYKNDQLDVDAVIRAYKDTPFFPSTFNAFEMGSKAEIPILINEEQDRKNSPPPHLPTTPVSERTIQPLELMTNRPFGTRNENVPDYVSRKLFE